MSADTSAKPPIKELLPPKPSPSSGDTQLPKPLQKVISDAQQPAEGTGEEETGSTGADGRGSSTNASADASSSPGLTWSWTVPYGGWRRFLQSGEMPYGSTTSFTTTVPAQGLPSTGAASVARVVTSAPQTPVYLWALLPLGLLLFWAAGLAVFEPAGERGAVVSFAASVRRTARELPAGMTRSVGRATVRVVRGFARWGRR